MARYLMSLGSNLDAIRADEELRLAVGFLRGIGQVRLSSGSYTTADIKGADRPPYHNMILTLDSPLTADRLNDACKEHERSRGRVKGAPEVVIDLDVVACDDTLLRPRDIAAPYFIAGLYRLRPM